MRLLTAMAIGLACLCDLPARAQSGIPVENVAGNSSVGPVCILTLRVEQLSWTLNPVEHMKDKANASMVEIPTMPEFCSQLRQGQVISSHFRWGSYLLRGSTGETVVTVERVSYSSPGSVR